MSQQRVLQTIVSNPGKTIAELSSILGSEEKWIYPFLNELEAGLKVTRMLSQRWFPVVDHITKWDLL